MKDACSKYFMLGVGINGSTLDNLTTYDEEYMAMVKKHLTPCETFSRCCTRIENKGFATL